MTTTAPCHVRQGLPGSLSRGLHSGAQVGIIQCDSFPLSTNTKQNPSKVPKQIPFFKATGCCAQVNTKPGARRGKKAGKKKKDEAAEAEDLDDDEQTQHDQEIEDAVGGLKTSLCLLCAGHTHGTFTAAMHVAFYVLMSQSLSADYPDES